MISHFENVPVNWGDGYSLFRTTGVTRWVSSKLIIQNTPSRFSDNKKYTRNPPTIFFASKVRHTHLNLLHNNTTNAITVTDSITNESNIAAIDSTTSPASFNLRFLNQGLICSAIAPARVICPCAPPAVLYIYLVPFLSHTILLRLSPGPSRNFSFSFSHDIFSSPFLQFTNQFKKHAQNYHNDLVAESVKTKKLTLIQHPKTINNDTEKY